MRGWLAVPLIGSDGDNYGFIQVSDRLELTCGFACATPLERVRCLIGSRLPR